MPIKSLCGSSKGQYLTIDAFIASMIVAVTLVIVLAARTALPYTSQSETISKSLAESLSQIKLNELNSEMVVNMSKAGNITSLDNTVLQQVTEFYFTKRKSQAFRLLQNVSEILIPKRFSFEVIVNSDLIYNRTVKSENSSSVLVSSKKLIFGVVNRTALVYGPTVAEVRLWQ